MEKGVWQRIGGIILLTLLCLSQAYVMIDEWSYTGGVIKYTERVPLLSFFQNRTNLFLTILGVIVWIVAVLLILLERKPKEKEEESD